MKFTVRKIKEEDIRRKELHHACKWYGEMLMGPRLTRNLYIMIQFSDIAEYGLSSPADDDEYRPREFDLFLRRGMNKTSILETVAHEMVHVKQFARGELRDFDTRNKPKYCGKVVHTTDLHYYDYPWEIEAYGRSIGLFNRYMEHLENKKK